MNENMRVSDADREHVAERLREHFADGRLTSEELDERITAALGAKTFGELHAVMADLPEPAPAWAPAAGGPAGGGPAAGQPPASWAARPVFSYRRRPRLLPLVLIVLFAALVLHGAGFVFAAFLTAVLFFWLIVPAAAIVAAALFGRRARRYRRSGPGSHWHHYEWHRQ
jgi:Domain of unknown function (DUF1707)